MGLVWQGGNGVDDLLREQVTNFDVVEDNFFGNSRLTKISSVVDLGAGIEETPLPRSPPSMPTIAEPLLDTAGWELLHTGAKREHLEYLKIKSAANVGAVVWLSWGNFCSRGVRRTVRNTAERTRGARTSRPAVSLRSGQSCLGRGERARRR